MLGYAHPMDICFKGLPEGCLCGDRTRVHCEVVDDGMKEFATEHRIMYSLVMDTQGAL